MAKSSPASRATEDLLPNLLRSTILAGVRDEGPDLTLRQLAVLLNIYLEPDGRHTVRGLAAALNISKPAITRALDRLEDLAFAKRQIDPLDRRSVLARRTPAGTAYFRVFRTYVTEAGGSAKNIE